MKVKEWVQSWYNPDIRKEGDNRDYFFDNLKAFLILLVVIGHFISDLRGIKEISRIYWFIHTFHMPCFAFASGYMAKGLMKNGKFRADRYFSTLWLYVFFRIANYAVMRAGGSNVQLDFFDVAAAPWYLLALSAWYLMVPLFLSMKPVAGILISTLAGLLIGYADNVGSYLALSRMLVFLPFFVIGLYLSKEQLNTFLNKKLRIAALLVLVFVCGYFVLIKNPMGGVSKLALGGNPYSTVLKSLEPYGFFIRGGLYLFGVLLSAAGMLLVPRRRMWFSYVGKYSLTVYILHILVRNALDSAGMYDWIKQLPGRYRLFMFPFCIILTLALANPVFGRLMNWIANPFRGMKRKKN